MRTSVVTWLYEPRRMVRRRLRVICWPQRTGSGGDFPREERWTSPARSAGGWNSGRGRAEADGSAALARDRLAPADGQRQVLREVGAMDFRGEIGEAVELRERESRGHRRHCA